GIRDGHVTGVQTCALPICDSRYVSLFASAFPNQNAPITIDNVARALASFERTLISAQSPYDRLVLYGDSNALSASAWRGRRLFLDRKSVVEGKAARLRWRW